MKVAFLCLLVHFNQMSENSLNSHYQSVIANLLEGRIVPFLGAGANLCDRPVGINWNRGHDLPSGAELAHYLGERYGFPQKAEDLVKVSQYVSVMNGTGPLYDDLRQIFDVDYAPTTLHRFFARVPQLLRKRDSKAPYPLLVTTNYDDLMERALMEVGEKFDTVAYVAEGEHSGKFRHIAADGSTRLIDKPNKYSYVSLDVRPVLLKVHGAVDRESPEMDSYVITEDDYIEYLSRNDISCQIPVLVRQKLLRSNFLFLGYGLRDWNLRAILHRIWGERQRSYSSWGVLLHPDSLDQKFWSKRDVENIDAPLKTYIEGLDQRLLETRWQENSGV
jgi:hypothetical protein